MGEHVELGREGISGSKDGEERADGRLARGGREVGSGTTESLLPWAVQIDWSIRNSFFVIVDIC